MDAPQPRPARKRREPPKPKPIDEGYLRRAALHYVERFGTSAQNLARVLERKAKRRAQVRTLTEDEARMIASTVATAISAGVVDDAAYARSKTGGLIRKGASERTILSKLRQKGVDADTAKASLPEAGIDEMAQALRLAQRKRLGPFRDKPDAKRRERDIASLARAGFSYRTATAVIDGGGS